jgi:hypothetical protein
MLAGLWASIRYPPNRLRDNVAQLNAGLLEHPCAVPRCKCVTHRLRLPNLECLAVTDYFAPERKTAKRSGVDISASCRVGRLTADGFYE